MPNACQKDCFIVFIRMIYDVCFNQSNVSTVISKDMKPRNIWKVWGFCSYFLRFGTVMLWATCQNIGLQLTAYFQPIVLHLLTDIKRPLSAKMARCLAQGHNGCKDSLYGMKKIFRINEKTLRATAAPVVE